MQFKSNDMRTRTILAVIAAATLAIACNPRTSITWTEGETDAEAWKATNTIVIQNPPSGTDWAIWFSQFKTAVEVEESSPARIEYVSGTLYRIVPTEEAKDGRLSIAYKANPLASQCRAPEAFFLQKNGEKPLEVPVTYEFLPCEKAAPIEYIDTDLRAEDMIPALKSVEYTEGQTPKNADVTTTIVGGHQTGWYRITVDGNISVEAADEDAAYWAGITLDNMRRNCKGDKLDNSVIEDWPDMSHRGYMLDVSRNFTRKEDLLKMIDLISHYKANVLHLHLGDDEGWRIEIDALPELTSYSGFRELPVLNEDGTISEPNALQSTYSGSRGRDDSEAPGNGFYSHEDFIEILQYAKEHHVMVVPEFDTPGHSRAAVKAMEKRAELTGDVSCLLSEAEDSSVYESVQHYTDNAINVAIPSTYRFIETVFDAIISLYKEADAPLLAIHIGGDEVPAGAWKKSPACNRLMEENGWTDINMLKDYYINGVLDIAEAKGVKIAGWQEIAQHLAPATFERLKDNLAYVNMWSVSSSKVELIYQFANEGVNVVLSNAPNAYMDMAYNSSKTERGHNWSGYVDERRSYSLLPYSVYKSIRWDDNGKICDISSAGEGKVALQEEGSRHILGTQAQLWTETIRSFDHVTYYTFPKVNGVLERGWNARPVWEGTDVSDSPEFNEAFGKFFSIVRKHEYPYFDEKGIAYHCN